MYIRNNRSQKSLFRHSIIYSKDGTSLNYKDCNRKTIQKQSLIIYLGGDHHPTWIQTGVGQQTPVIITSQHYVCTVYCVLWTVHTLHARRRHQSSPPQHSEQSICKYAVKQLSAEWDTDSGTRDWAWHQTSEDVRQVMTDIWHLLSGDIQDISSVTMMSSGEEDITVSETAFISFNQDTT